MGIGKQLKDVMDIKNINVNQFANNLGLRPQRIYNIINRDTKKVDNELVEKMALVLCIPIEYFYSDDPLSDFIQTKLNNSIMPVQANKIVNRNSHSDFSYIMSKEDVQDSILNTKEVIQLVIENNTTQNQQTFRNQYLNYCYSMLNEKGKIELLKRTAEMLQIDEYKNKSDDK